MLAHAEALLNLGCLRVAGVEALDAHRIQLAAQWRAWPSRDWGRHRRGLGLRRRANDAVRGERLTAHSWMWPNALPTTQPAASAPMSPPRRRIPTT